MNSGFKDHVPREPVPDVSLLHFGPEPGWATHREDQPPDSCTECGLPLIGIERYTEWDIETGAVICQDEEPVYGEDDPLAALETAIVVCSGCHRTRYTGRLHGTEKHFPRQSPVVDQMSQRAYRVSGKADPDISPYRKEEALQARLDAEVAKKAAHERRLAEKRQRRMQATQTGT